MYKNQKVTVFMPAYNEKEGITQTVKEFKNNNFVDEVLVIDNNSKDGTGSLAKKAGARVVFETKQGYGAAMARGFREAKGDLIISVESDGTFNANDVEKFLVYSDEFDMILGTRTNSALLSEGANMGSFLKWGNVFIAKLLEVIHNSPSLTDVGCTYRLIKKNKLQKFVGKIDCQGSNFLPNFTIIALKHKMKMVEIPVNYGKRKGTSKITGSKVKAFKLGLKMIWTIIKKKFTKD